MIIKHVPGSTKTLLNIPTAQGQLETFHPIGFMGYRLDKASGCYLLGNGYWMYSPVMRAFYSPDSQSPFGVGGISRFQYCYFDPINRSDPSGHVSRMAVGGTILGILGIIVGIYLQEVPAWASWLGGASFGMASLGAAGAPASSLLSLSGGSKLLAVMGGQHKWLEEERYSPGLPPEMKRR